MSRHGGVTKHMTKAGMIYNPINCYVNQKNIISACNRKAATITSLGLLFI